ncbi:acetolactate synthase AlsS [Polynucleobacter asymbioticus]|uniref:acetolactate synthase AlsS n=1 Tax=Polynucleobacter asymbioticus TaxID=576611 RepID=UPI0008F95A30|nr:acetolactate synthase AlsS [Polynucleobacter asymbioticus]
MSIEPNNVKNCANAIVRILENHGVTHVFGIPGAKIDSLFIALKHSKIKLILCQHEQNAAFMAAAFGRLTGKVGVCIATSGPGVTNLTTGLATATSEGDPVLAIGGEVPLGERLKKTHQSLDSTALMNAATKLSAEITTADQLGEIMGNAIRVAESGRPGAVFLSLPKDVGLADYPGDMDASWGKKLPMGPAAQSTINEALDILKISKRPIAILGMQSSTSNSSEALINFFKQSGIPYVSTFQGAGSWVAASSGVPYAGRIGLFRNQPADNLLDQADAIVLIGYDPIEYDPSIWNTDLKRPIICIDTIPAYQDNAFLPVTELIGDIGESLNALASTVKTQIDPAFIVAAQAAVKEVHDTLDEGKLMNKFPVQPLRLVYELQKQMTPNTHVALDVGSNYIWTNRYCAADHARQVMVSNGQQTLGVALPWAIAMSLLYPGERILSSSGDGGFLFTGTELATAVRIGAKFVHVIWDSGSFDMVAFQEQAHYGETAGIKLGSYDPVKFAESFGCKGYSVQSADDLPGIFEEAFKSDVPVLIHVPVDYSLNERLMENVIQSFIN